MEQERSNIAKHFEVDVTAEKGSYNFAFGSELDLIRACVSQSITEKLLGRFLDFLEMSVAAELQGSRPFLGLHNCRSILERASSIDTSAMAFDGALQFVVRDAP